MGTIHTGKSLGDTMQEAMDAVANFKAMLYTITKEDMERLVASGALTELQSMADAIHIDALQIRTILYPNGVP